LEQHSIRTRKSAIHKVKLETLHNMLRTNLSQNSKNTNNTNHKFAIFKSEKDF